MSAVAQLLLQLAIVLGVAHLLLAQVARLAHDDVAEQIASAREPRRVMALLEALGA